ncbi:transpeptidase family protein [Saprospiraceae bacterium]|nr:transpeptidase family protein [Saprospiraceae bacterium]
MDRRRELLLRVYIVFLAFVLFAGAILFQVIKINVVEGDKWRKKAVNNLAWRNVEAERGDIFAENGGSMVTSVTLFDIYMDLTVSKEKDFVDNVDSLSYYLAKYSGKGKSKDRWKSELVAGRKAGLENNKPGTKYYPIAKNLDVYARNRFKNFPLFSKGQLRGGIIIKSKIRRVKPFGQMASRLLGLKRKNSQDVGIEAAYDKYLAGESHKHLMKKIARGVWVPLEDVKEFRKKRGFDVLTTIDSDIQDIVHNELLASIAKHDSDAATAIVMDVETGAIKAMSNFKRGEEGVYMETENIAVTRMFEPGSTIKLAAVLALLEKGYVDSSTKVNLKGGKKKFYSEWMYDSEPHNIFETDLITAFAKSSNVGIATLADEYFNKSIDGRREFIRMMKSFGIGAKSGIDLVGEQERILNDPDNANSDFSGTSVPWMAHGYEMEMTPLQVLNLYNTVANGGKMMTPYLVEKVLDQGVVKQVFGPKVKREAVASLPTIHEAQDMLIEVVNSGTAKRLKTEHYQIAGKTGTSKDYGVWYEGKNPFNASFAGYFPAENPKYSIIVVHFNPKNHGYYGGSVAGPVFRNVADKIFALKVNLKHEFYKENKVASNNYRKPSYSVGYKSDFQNILSHSGVPVKESTKSRWVVLSPYNDDLALEKKKIKKKIVPNVVGMGIRDAVYVLENLGLHVDFDGSGRVVSQSLSPGTTIKGQEIIIRLG